jgi:hypothetical protein
MGDIPIELHTHRSINDILKILCTATEIILATINKDFTTLARNKIVTMLAFDFVPALLTLRAITNDLHLLPPAYRLVDVEGIAPTRITRDIAFTERPVYFSGLNIRVN